MCAQKVSCYFCGEASHHDSTLQVPMFMIDKVQRVETAYKTSTVQYEKRVFTIPRCAACRRRHGIENALGTVIGTLGLLAVLGAVLLALSKGIGWGAGFLLLAVVILALAAALQERLLYGGKENLALKHRETWPQVHMSLTSGWQLGEGPSRAQSMDWARERQKERDKEQENLRRTQEEQKQAKARAKKAISQSNQAYQLGQDGNVEKLLCTAQDPNNGGRSTAIEMLGEMSHPDALEPLLGMLADPARPSDHGRLALALAGYADPRITPAIQAAVDAAPDRASQAVKDMRRALNLRATPALLALKPVRDADEAQRRAYALYAQGDVQGLIEIALNPQEQGRSRAVQLLGDTADPQALEALLTLLADPAQAALYGRAAKAAARYPDPRVAAAIQAAEKALPVSWNSDIWLELIQSDLRNALYECSHLSMLHQPLSSEEAIKLSRG